MRRPAGTTGKKKMQRTGSLHATPCPCKITNVLAVALECVGDLADGYAVPVGVGDVDVTVQRDALTADALEGDALQRRLGLGDPRHLLRHEPLGLVHQARHQPLLLIPSALLLRRVHASDWNGSVVRCWIGRIYVSLRRPRFLSFVSLHNREEGKWERIHGRRRAFAPRCGRACCMQNGCFSPLLLVSTTALPMQCDAARYHYTTVSTACGPALVAKPIILRSILLLLIILSSETRRSHGCRRIDWAGSLLWGAGGRLFLRVRVETTTTQDK
jgi:hypothetical protein